jgi:hypothetical protein
MIRSASTPKIVPRAIGNTCVEDEGLAALDVVDAGDEESEVELRVPVVDGVGVNVAEVVVVSAGSSAV